MLPPGEFPGVIDCGTFQDNFVDFFSGTQTTFFDANGDPTRLVFHIAHHSNDVNSVTGLAIHEHGHFTVTIDLATGTLTVTGNSEVANRPGMGSSCRTWAASSSTRTATSSSSQAAASTASCSAATRFYVTRSRKQRPAQELAGRTSGGGRARGCPRHGDFARADQARVDAGISEVTA
jgi:hypothetical protein